jgi:hypothetical protein
VDTLPRNRHTDSHTTDRGYAVGPAGTGGARTTAERDAILANHHAHARSA